MPFITLSVDQNLYDQVNAAVASAGDTDRSKFVRTALREKLGRIRSITVVRPTDADEAAEPVVYVDIEK